MSKPEPPPLPSNIPSQFPSPPAPPQQKPLPQSVVEYITAFDKPLTKDEKVAWLGEIAHRVLNGELPQEVYPFLRDKIEGLPEALPSPNRLEEKIPGSDYVHPTGSKPYVPLIRENPTFRSTDLSSTQTTSRSKANDSSFSALIGIVVFFAVCFVAYGVGSWVMKTPLKKRNVETVSIVGDIEPVKTEVKTDNPFAEEPAQEIMTDNPFSDETIATIKGLEKEVFRIALKLDDNGKCTYNVEKTKTPLPESYAGQPISLFPNAKSWKSDDGPITTLHDFKTPDTWNDLFVTGTKERVTFDESFGRFVMQYGPELWSGGMCHAIYSKRMYLPIEIIADIDDTEYFRNSYSSEIRLSFSGSKEAQQWERGKTMLWFIFNGQQVYVPWRANHNENERTIHRNEGKDDLFEGSFDFPRTEMTYPLMIGFHDLAHSRQPNNGKIGISKIVMKGKFTGDEILTDNPFADSTATDNPLAE